MKMKTRKAHLKSRNGCSNCKKQHVKCDEQGPPCANCVSRNTHSTCVYRNTPSASGPHTKALTLTTSHSSGRSSNSSESSTLAQNPAFLGYPSELNNLLQLELMHHWSTRTYKSFVGFPEIAAFMQSGVPRRALEEGNLLKGMFAVAALEIASTDHPRAAWYARRAMEFYNASSESFRSHLANINNENLDWVFMYCSMATPINSILASSFSPQRPAIDTMLTIFQLYHGHGSVVERHWQSLLVGPYGTAIKVALEFFSLPLTESLDEATEEAFRWLNVLLDIGIATNLHQIQGSPCEYETWEMMYRIAIPMLYLIFKHDEKQEILGLCFVYRSLIGQDFAKAIGDREPMALILVMFLAVLIDRMTYKAWWTKGLGVRVAAETTQILLNSHCGLSTLPEFYKIIDWANQQLGTRVYLCFGDGDGENYRWKWRLVSSTEDQRISSNGVLSSLEINQAS